MVENDACGGHIAYLNIDLCTVKQPSSGLNHFVFGGFGGK